MNGVDRRQVLSLAGLVGGIIAMQSRPLAAAATTEGAMNESPKRVVFVHGRGQEGLDPAKLKTQWVETLQRGAQALGKHVPDQIEVAFPYYGDALDRLVRQSEVPLTVDIHTRGSQVDDEFLAFQAQVAEELRHGAGVSDTEVDAEYGANPKPKGPLNWEWVQAIFRALDKHAGGMSSDAIEAFIRDVFLYTTRAGARDEIDRIVAAGLTEAPAIVIAHSLGSVVAYNILRSDRRQLRVPLYLTVGCPLAIRAIRDQLRPLRFPQPVAAWYNAFDRRDVVALYPLDGANFPVTPPVENYGNVNNHTDNRHGIVGYLDNPTVANHILDALGV